MYAIQLDWEYLTNQLDPRWTMKLQHLQTIQTSHCQRDVENMTSWHAAAFSDSAEPTTHQALAPSSPIWLLYKLISVTDVFIFSASAKAWRQQQIKAGISFVVLPSKPDCWNPSTNWHSTETCRIPLIQNLEKQSRNPRFHSASTYINLLTTQLNPRWTMKLQHLQTIQTSHCQRMSKTWHHDMPQHSTQPTTHQALAPSAPIWFSLKLMFATEAFIFSASAKAWRQRQIKVGLSFVVSTVKTWSLKSHEQFTFNWEISNLSDSKLEKTIPIQHLHICWQLNSIRDEWWNYTAPPNHSNLSLSQDVGDMTSSIKSPQHSVEPTTHHALAFPRPPNLVSSQTDVLRRTHLSSAPRPRPGNIDRSRLASSSSRALPFKMWSLKSGEHMTFNSDMWISLIQELGKQSRNQQLLTASTYLTTLLDQRWMMKLQHLRKNKFYFCQRMSRTWTWIHAAAFNGAHHTPGLGPLVANPVVIQTDICDGRVYLQRLGPRPGGSDRSRLPSRFQGPTDKTWLLKCSKQMTFNGEILQTSPVHSDHSAIFSIRKFADNSTRSEMNDETTAPPNHPNFSLSKDVENMTSWHAAAFSDSAEPIPHTRPCPPRHQLSIAYSMFVTDAFILSASAKSWRQRQIKAFSQKAVWIETWP